MSVRTTHTSIVSRGTFTSVRSECFPTTNVFFLVFVYEAGKQAGREVRDLERCRVVGGWVGGLGVPLWRASSRHTRRRQAHVLFGGIPDFEAYLPYGVRVWDLLPLDLDREEELKERRVADKANAFLVDQRWKMGKQMKWSLARAEVLALLQVFEGVGCVKVGTLLQA